MVGSEWGPRIQRISWTRSTVVVAPRLRTSVNITDSWGADDPRWGMISAKWPWLLVYRLHKEPSKCCMGHPAIPKLAVLSSGTWRQFRDSLKLQRRGHQRLISISTSDLDVDHLRSPILRLTWGDAEWLWFVLLCLDHFLKAIQSGNAFPIHFPLFSRVVGGTGTTAETNVGSQNSLKGDPNRYLSKIRPENTYFWCSSTGMGWGFGIPRLDSKDASQIMCYMGMDQYLLYNTIFRWMNIHLPAILMFTRGPRFWHTAIYF